MKNLKKVLVVDSDPEFVDGCRKVFEAGSYQVLFASDEPHARDMMTACPDLIVLSTLSPGGRAFSLHNWIKRHYAYKTIPLMVIDAPYEEAQLKGWRQLEGLQIEADEYLSKPVDLTALLPLARRLNGNGASHRVN